MDERKDNNKKDKTKERCAGQPLEALLANIDRQRTNNERDR